ncbi:MAG: hypothetical protein ACAF41_16970 [Leptolyngbya sp. BL-A-14]
MKAMVTIKNNSISSTTTLWTPLSEGQQELLSGGAPILNGGGGGNGSGGSGSGSSIVLTLTI